MTTRYAPKLTILSLTIATALQVAWAQDAENKDSDKASDEPIEVIEVQGIRGSLEDALNKKRMADRIVDSISAEDVGKFPDDNIAEALQRIPGVSIGRDETGSGDVVSIRGMGPDLNKVTMNGKQMASAGGVGSTGQGFDFGVLSADMISALEVWKSPVASQDAGSIGGSVNIRTKSPLELKRTDYRLSIEQGYQEVGSHHSNKYSGRVITQFSDNKVGLSFGLNSSSSPLRTDSAGANSYPNPKNPVDLIDANGNPVDPNDAFIINGYRLQQRTANRDKLGGDFSLQFRPNNSFDLRIDGLYAEQDDNDYADQFMLLFNQPNRLVREGLVDDNGFVTEFYAEPKNPNQRQVQLQTWKRDQERSTQSLSANADWIMNDTMQLTAALGTSDGEREMKQFFPVFQATGSVAYNANTSDSPRFPDLYINGQMMMPEDSEFVLTALNNQIKAWEDSNDFAQLDFEMDTGSMVFHTFSAGVKATNSSSSQIVDKGKISGNLGTMADFYGRTTSDHAYYQDTPYSAWSVADFDKIAAVWGAFEDIPFDADYNVNRDEIRSFGSPIEDWEVDHDVRAIYVQSDFEGEFIWPVRGNVGVRYEHTDMTAYSMTEVAGTFEPIEVTNSYSDVLPSINMAFAINDDMLLRVSAAKVMSRPIARDLAPAYRLSSSEEDATGNGGNPFLEPFRATQLDIGWEWYFDEAALFSVGYFMKDVSSFIAREGSTQTIEGIEYLITSPVNGDSAKIQGVEFGYQQNFTFLPGFLADTGIQLNYTYTDSDTNFINDTFNRRLPLEGLSKNTVNATVFYEKQDFSVRVAYTYRDNFLQSGTSWAPNPIFRTAFSYLDAQVGYRLNKHIQFGLKLNNLTDTEEEQYVWEERYPMSTSTFGRNYTLTMTLKY